MNKSKILLIYTGGTIGMNRNPATVMWRVAAKSR